MVGWNDDVRVSRSDGDDASSDDEGGSSPHDFKSSSFSIPTTCGYCKVCTHLVDSGIQNIYESTDLYLGTEQTRKNVQGLWIFSSRKVRAESGGNRSSLFISV